MKSWKKYLFIVAAGIVSLAAYKFDLGTPATLSVLAVNDANVVVADTVAGYDTSLTVRNLTPLESGELFVSKPDGSDLRLQFRADSSGDVDMTVDGYHLKQAGLYAVDLKTSNSSVSGVASFEVLADKVSVTDSKIFSNKKVVRSDGRDFVTIDVRVTDSFNNPLKNHEINLISSRIVDDVVLTSQVNATDSEGVVSFEVRSTEPGVSTLVAYDNTDQVTLRERAEVLFSSGFGSLANAGGDEKLLAFVPTAYAQSISGGPVSKFSFVDLDSNVSANQNLTFKLRAVDNEGNRSENYLGKVHFSAEGAGLNNAVLPDDYQFTADDLGEHIFSLGLSFKAAGSYKIVATDLNDNTLHGEFNVTVTASGSAAGSNSEVKISAPVAGTYNQGQQEVSGIALPGIALKVYDRDLEIGGVDADVDGKFSFKTPLLTDGEHVLKVVAVNDAGNAIATSDPVTITVDTTAPDLGQLTLDPSGPVVPESLVKVELVTDSGLAQVAVIVNQDFAILSEDLSSPGNYRGSFLAPKAVGTYAVDLVLVDSLGNESQLKGQKSLIVAEQGAVVENSSGNEPAASVELASVENVKSYAGDGRVTLEWKPVAGALHYRVYYGIRADSLVNAVDTFEGLNKWYVPNLKNGVEYFFAVSAVNKDGVESKTRSEIVSGIPFAADLTGSPSGIVQDSLFNFNNPSGAGLADVNLKNVKSAASEVPGLGETGPELYLLISLTFLGTFFYSLSRKRV